MDLGRVKVYYVRHCLFCKKKCNFFAGTLTCSTCHLIFSKDTFNSLPNKPSEEELDMLDLAYDLCDTSRLGCQIILTEQLDGLKVNVPATINDARS